MSSQAEAVVREALELLGGIGEDHRVSELVDPGYRDRSWPALERGSEGFRALRTRLHDAFADIELLPREMILDDDGWVVVRLRFRGLHVAPYAGVEPCGRTIEVDEIHVWRLRDGRLVEHWALRDELGLLRQMGVDLPSLASRWPRAAGSTCTREHLGQPPGD